MGPTTREDDAVYPEEALAAGRLPPATDDLSMVLVGALEKDDAGVPFSLGQVRGIRFGGGVPRSSDCR